jgi:GT2 family glycosyltransferase
MSHDTPIFLMSFNRPGYLRKVLKSLVGQEGISFPDRKIVLFQDGAVNPYSGKRHANDDDIEACIAVFRKFFPHGTVLASPVNLGVGLNFDRAERFGFEDLKADAVIFLEDDLALGPHYLAILEHLIELFLYDTRVGYVAAYGDQKRTLDEQRTNPRRLIMLEHNWGFALYRRQWSRMRPRVPEYLGLIKDVDYREKDATQIRQLFASWGFGCPAISQDAAKTIACCVDDVIKLNTFVCNGTYIGEHGLHMNPDLFRRRGYLQTVIYPKKVDAFEPLDDRVYRDVLAKQLGWAGKPSTSNPASKPEQSRAEDASPVAGPELLIKAAYRGILGRDPDPDGLSTYLQHFKGRPVEVALEITLERLLLSAEFSRRWYARRGWRTATTAQSGRNLIPAADVEIVMLTYNEQDMLPYSLPALAKHFDNFLFLDMESTDQTKEVIADLLRAKPAVRVAPYKREYLLDYGYAHARNFASLHCQKPWLFVVDADEILAGGVKDGKIRLDRLAAATAIVSCERRNLKPGDWQPGEPLDISRLPLGRKEAMNRLLSCRRTGQVARLYT